MYVITTNVTEGVRLLGIQPESSPERDAWRVRLPHLDGSRYWITLNDQLPEDHFGRFRWYDQYPSRADPDKRAVLRPTAPADLQLWDTWTQPEQFRQLLSDQMQPSVLEKRLGSPLAALQLVVDVWDHLLIRDKLPLTVLSASTTALLSSAKSRLESPQHFFEAISAARRQASESESRRPEAELQRSLAQIAFLSRLSSSFSAMRNLAYPLHQVLMQELLALHQRHLPLISRWKLNQTPQLTTPTTGPVVSVEIPGTLARSLPAPVPPTHLVLVKKRDEPLRVETRPTKLVKMSV